MADWHESFPNDLEKAREVLTGNVPMNIVSEQTGIGKVSLSNYRTGKTDLNRASWQTIHKLAKFWDNLRIQPEFSQPGFLPFLNQLHDWFDKVGNLDPGDPMYAVIQSMGAMVTTDQMMLLILYKTYQEAKS